MRADKHYKLFNPKGAQDGKPPPCAFFGTAKGCKNGANCKFSHDLPGLKNKTLPATCTRASGNVSPTSSSVGSSVVSSEESESDDNVGGAAPISSRPLAMNEFTPSTSMTTTVGTRDDVSCSSSSVASSEDGGGGNNDDDPFGTKRIKGPVRQTQKKSSSVTVKSPIVKKRRRSTDNQAMNNSQAAVEVASPQPPKRNTPKKKKTKTKRTSDQHNNPTASTASSTTPNFQNLDLPIAQFSCYDETTNSNIPTTPRANPTSPKTPSTPKPTAPKAPPAPKPLPIPHSTPEGLRWQNACLATRRHPRYETTYNPSRMRANTAKYDPNATWITAKPFGEWCRNNPHAIAIDFEMCETKCPSTGRINPKALCRMSVIDASKPDVVLLDTLVKPDWPVTDYRTRINGIEVAHLDNVQFTMEHARTFMSALCSEETVIIGHAVDNDLAALQMVHRCVVDSAFLFSLKDEGDKSCSLKDLSMAVLKREMPATHDSVNDARVTLLCIEEGYMLKKERGEEVEPIVRTHPTKSLGGSSTLFVHRIPKGCKPQHIEGMFLTYSNIKPKEVPEIQFSADKDTGKVTVVFSTEEHVKLAFHTLVGKAKEDTSGNLQKRIYMKNGGYVNVRLSSKTRTIKNDVDATKETEQVTDGDFTF